jgi:hypothetical protein
LPKIPRVQEDTFGGFLFNQLTNGGVRDDLFRFVDSLDERDRYSFTFSVALGKNNKAFTRGTKLDLSINLDGKVKVFGGQGLIKGRSVSLTGDFNFPIGPKGPSDTNINAKFSKTTPARGFLGTKFSGNIGSGGASAKAGVGLVFGSSGTKPAIGFTQDIFIDEEFDLNKIFGD